MADFNLAEVRERLVAKLPGGVYVERQIIGEQIPPQKTFEFGGLFDAKEMAARRANVKQATEADIYAAIARIDNGTFGFCLECEGELTLKRIKAAPEARYCIPCQEAIEAQQPSIPQRIALANSY
jgi:DnaK suppressor protein